MASLAVFEKNLGALRQRCPWIVPALESASAEGIEEVVGPRGARVLSERGVLLASAYDPVREAEKLAEQMSSPPADIMVAIGFGLGLHFERYCERNPNVLIVFEPSISRLRAALERTSIEGLFEKYPEVFIAHDLERLSSLIEAFYVTGLCIRVVPYAPVMRLDEQKVTNAVDRIRRVKEASDTRAVTSVEQMIPWSRIVAMNGRRISSCPSFSCLEDSFAGKTAVIVAAGPSLDQHLPLLEERRDEVVVIAIGQTTKTLSVAGIRPHLVHVLESRNVSHQLTEGTVSEDLNVVLFPDCHPAIFDVPTRSTFVATPSLSPMGNWIAQARGDERFVIGGGTVAQGAVGLADMMGVERILLIGQDLAFTDGRTYAKNSAYDFVGYQVGSDGQFSWTKQKAKVALLGDHDDANVIDTHETGEVVWVEGWNEGERVQTWRAYASFIEQYREIGAYLRGRGVELINCTEGGARIHGLRHSTFREALDESGRERLDADRVIETAAHSAPVLELESFRRPISEALEKLAEIEKNAERGLRLVQRASRKIEGRADEKAILGALRGLARQEKKVRKNLRDLPWFDVLVQPEIYAARAAVRRVDRQDPTLEEVVEESEYLFEAACRGIERARSWFADFEESFGAPQFDRNDGTMERKREPLSSDEKPSGHLAPPT